MKLPIPITISDATGKTWSFDRLDCFRKFVEEEESFWKEKHTELGLKGLTNTYLNVFTQLASVIELTKDLKTMLSSSDELSTKAHIANYQAAQLNPLSTSWVWSGHTFITSWLNSYKLSQATGDTFIQIILSKTISYPSLANYDYFKGCLLAYEYDLQDESLITKRRDAETESFNLLKDRLVTEKNELASKISDFETKADNVTKTYIDHMRLEGPAKYWKDRAIECKEEGDKWAGWLMTTIIVAIATFGSLMVAWLNKSTTKLDFNNLEGIAIIIIALSFFIFALRTLAKLTFSSYHLQRDAEEREQLTHLYLALANDSKVDAESRNIVLQALFSRSESGLLSGDSGPTLPVQDIVGLIKNQKPN